MESEIEIDIFILCRFYQFLKDLFSDYSMVQKFKQLYAQYAY